jgi:hypothetical protein
LLLILVTGTTAGGTWRNQRHALDRLYLVTLATPDDQVALQLPTSPRFFDFIPVS